MLSNRRKIYPSHHPNLIDSHGQCRENAYIQRQHTHTHFYTFMVILNNAYTFLCIHIYIYIAIQSDHTPDTDFEKANEYIYVRISNQRVTCKNAHRHRHSHSHKTSYVNTYANRNSTHFLTHTDAHWNFVDTDELFFFIRLLNNWNKLAYLKIHL